MAGAGLVATSFGVNDQFANRSWTMLAIDGGYHAVQYVLLGLVLGLWHVALAWACVAPSRRSAVCAG